MATVGPTRPASGSLVWRWLGGMAALSLAGLLSLFFVVDQTVMRASERIVQQAVATDLAGLVDIQVTSGTDELVARIEDRLAVSPVDGDARHYLLVSGEGGKLAGDLERWPEISAETSETAMLDIGQGAVGQATMLEPGLRVLVAHEYASQAGMRADIRVGFAVTALVVLLALLFWAWFVSRGLRSRVDAINTVFRMIGASDDPMVPQTDQPDDELGELARHAELVTMRIGALLKSQRQVNDHLAHELRTPLVHLDNRLDKLAEHVSGEAASIALGQARESIRELVQLLESLLDIAVTEARAGDRMGLATVDFSELLEKLADLYADSAEELGIQFESEIEPDVIVQGDRAMLQRLASNLLDNAFKFAPVGGEVTLTLNGGPVMSVADNGPGVPDEWKDRIFQRFERAGSKEKGHGLGLALCRAIAGRHGMEIRVHDNHPGARFVVEAGGKV